MSIVVKNLTYIYDEGMPFASKALDNISFERNELLKEKKKEYNKSVDILLKIITLSHIFLDKISMVLYWNIIFDNSSIFNLYIDELSLKTLSIVCLNIL